MKINKELFRQVIKDNFFREFFDGREASIRYNISVICSACSEISNHLKERESRQFINQILNNCSQILKLTEVYRNLSEVLDENPIERKFIEINDFLNEFCKRSSGAINKMFKIKYIPNKAYAVHTDEKCLRFAMLICVRRALLSGASRIEISYTTNKDECVIGLKFMNFRDEELEIPIAENITTDYADDIILTVISEIGGKYRSDENSAEIILPAKDDGLNMISTSECWNEKNFFNPYTNILSDLLYV